MQSHRLKATAAMAGALVGSWGATACLGRDARPQAVAWTDPAFALCLAVTYVGIWSALAVWAGDRKRVLFRAVSTTASLVVVLLVLELPAFIGVLDYRAVGHRLTGRTPDPTANFIDDPHLAFRRPSNTSWTGRRRGDLAEAYDLPAGDDRVVTFTTDSRGFRNRVEPKEANVVLIGDSYVESIAVSDDETLAVLLEEQTGLVVANLGQAGYGTLQELEVLRRLGLPLRPKVVAWFFFEGNDLYNDQLFENITLWQGEHPSTASDGNRSRRTSPRIEWRKKWKSFRKASLTRNLFRLIRRLGSPVVPDLSPCSGWFRDEDGRDRRIYFADYAENRFGEFEEGRFAVTQDALREAARLTREQDARLVIFYVPTKFRVYGDHCRFPSHSPCSAWKSWDLPERFDAFCRDAGIPCVDLTPVLRKAAAAGRLAYFPDDSHWNVTGERLVVERVREALSEHGPSKLVDR